MNQFPHYFLTKENRNQTLPISIAYVYVAICRRLGLEASQTNTPNVICCYIRSPDPDGGDLFLDMTRESRPFVFPSRDASAIAEQTGVRVEHVPMVFLPAPSSMTLRRMVGNIRASTMPGLGVGTDALNDPDRPLYQYATMVADSVAPDPMMFSPFPDVPYVPLEFWLDYQAVLIDVLGRWEGEQFTGAIRELITREVESHRQPRRRDGLVIKYFVGQVVEVDGERVGFVAGWETTVCDQVHNKDRPTDALGTVGCGILHRNDEWPYPH